MVSYEKKEILSKYFDEISKEEADQIFRDELGYDGGVEDSTSVPENERAFWLLAKPEYRDVFGESGVEIVLVTTSGNVEMEMGAWGSISALREILTVIDSIENMKDVSENKKIKKHNSLDEDYEVSSFLKRVAGVKEDYIKKA